MTTRRSGWLESRHDLARPHELLGRRGRLTASMYAIGCIPSRRDTSDVSSRCQDRARSTSRCRYPTLPVSVSCPQPAGVCPLLAGALRRAPARPQQPFSALQCIRRPVRSHATRQTCCSFRLSANSNHYELVCSCQSSRPSSAVHGNRLSLAPRSPRSALRASAAAEVLCSDSVRSFPDCSHSDEAACSFVGQTARRSPRSPRSPRSALGALSASPVGSLKLSVCVQFLRGTD